MCNAREFVEFQSYIETVSLFIVFDFQSEKVFNHHHRIFENIYYAIRKARIQSTVSGVCKKHEQLSRTMSVIKTAHMRNEVDRMFMLTTCNTAKIKRLEYGQEIDAIRPESLRSVSENGSFGSINK